MRKKRRCMCTLASWICLQTFQTSLELASGLHAWDRKRINETAWDSIRQHTKRFKSPLVSLVPGLEAARIKTWQLEHLTNIHQHFPQKSSALFHHLRDSEMDMCTKLSVQNRICMKLLCMKCFQRRYMQVYVAKYSIWSVVTECGRSVVKGCLLCCVLWRHFAQQLSFGVVSWSLVAKLWSVFECDLMLFSIAAIVDMSMMYQVHAKERRTLGREQGLHVSYPPLGSYAVLCLFGQLFHERSRGRANSEECEAAVWSSWLSNILSPQWPKSFWVA